MARTGDADRIGGAGNLVLGANRSFAVAPRVVQGCAGPRKRTAWQNSILSGVDVTRIASLFLIAVALCCTLLSACSKKSEEPVPDWDDAETVMVITNRTDELELVLTTAGVALKLSEQKLAEIETKLDQERDDGDESGAAANFKNFVLDSVESMLNQQVAYPLDSVREMRWEDGEIVIEVDGEGFISFKEVSVDGDMALETFDEKDALAFIAAFDKLKRSR